jgi:hypothetical protein
LVNGGCFLIEDWILTTISRQKKKITTIKPHILSKKAKQAKMAKLGLARGLTWQVLKPGGLILKGPYIM